VEIACSDWPISIGNMPENVKTKEMNPYFLTWKPPPGVSKCTVGAGNFVLDGSRLKYHFPVWTMDDFDFNVKVPVAESIDVDEEFIEQKDSLMEGVDLNMIKEDPMDQCDLDCKAACRKESITSFFEVILDKSTTFKPIVVELLEEILLYPEKEYKKKINNNKTVLDKIITAFKFCKLKSTSKPVN
jgi:hypothetical protein